MYSISLKLTSFSFQFFIVRRSKLFSHQYYNYILQSLRTYDPHTNQHCIKSQRSCHIFNINFNTSQELGLQSENAKGMVLNFQRSTNLDSTCLLPHHILTPKSGGQSCCVYPHKGVSKQKQIRPNDFVLRFDDFQCKKTVIHFVKVYF